MHYSGAFEGGGESDSNPTGWEDLFYVASVSDMLLPEAWHILLNPDTNLSGWNMSNMPFDSVVVSSRFFAWLPPCGLLYGLPFESPPSA